MLRFLFSTGSLYSYGISRCFELAQRAGFDGIELMVDRRWDSRQIEYLSGLVDRCCLPIVSVHAPLAGEIIAGWSDCESERIEQTVRLAEALHAEVVVHHLPFRIELRWVRIRTTHVPLPAPGQRNTYYDWLLHDYAGLQAATRVTLCIENMPAIHKLGRRWNVACWNTPAQLTRFPNLTLDTTHLGTWGLDPEAVYEQLRGRVRHMHLSNFDGKEHRRPEAGHLQLDRLLARLGADRFTGTVTLELSPDALSAGSPDEEVAELMAGSLEFCRRAARMPLAAPQPASAG